MIIESVHVQNFRCLKEVTLSCEALTTLVGPNGSGKSSFLRALELFYQPSATCYESDCYARDPDEEIVIEVTFSDLAAEETDLFRKRVQGGKMTVARVFPAGGGPGTFHGFALQHSRFTEIRGLAANPKRAEYRKLRDEAHYKELPNAGSAAEVDRALDSWEDEHPDELERSRDDGRFIGFTNVAAGNLGKFTKFVLIPAVRDSADEEAGRGSGISQLMELVVQRTLSQRRDIQLLQKDVDSRINTILNSAETEELAGLAKDLSETLKTYYPGVDLNLSWKDYAPFQMPVPSPQVHLIEDGFQAPLVQTGHGLQRAFILSVLQYLAMIPPPQPDIAEEDETESELPGEEESKTEAQQPQVTLILGIEEPELYQHPGRQRHFAKILSDLARGEIPGVAANVQVIYGTHSPLMVRIDDFDQIRRCIKVDPNNGKPKTTSVIRSDWQSVAEELWVAEGSQGEKFTRETIKARVQTLLHPWMNEGFFANAIILVEGPGDRAAILAMFEIAEIHIEGEDFAVIPCEGKTKLDKALVIFRSLGIPTYVIWDNDKGKNKNDEGEHIKGNRRLLSLLRAKEEDWPSEITDHYACLCGNLEKLIERELEPVFFEAELSAQKERYGLTRHKDARKSALVLRNILTKAYDSGKTCESLEQIVLRISILKNDTHLRDQVASRFKLTAAD